MVGAMGEQLRTEPVCVESRLQAASLHSSSSCEIWYFPHGALSDNDRVESFKLGTDQLRVLEGPSLLEDAKKPSGHLLAFSFPSLYDT
jgi:hypothetical protein